MHKFIALATIMSTPLFAVESPRVLETTRYQDGLIEVIIQSEAVAKTSGPLSRTRSKLMAQRRPRKRVKKFLILYAPKATWKALSDLAKLNVMFLIPARIQ